MSQRFQRRAEDFTCAHCGLKVHGDGYTNHCPRCLWSKHVDVDPGDRAEACGGLMKPIAVELHKDHFRLRHHCEKCGQERNNRSGPQDDHEVLVALARQLAFERSH